LSQLPAGSFVFDIGCGNGKYLGVNKEIYMVGTDRSMGLLEIAQEKSDGYELFAADCLNLPLRSDLCDAFLCIAVIHHFSKE
jgi:ubiquinone/menaquinone biosynthesis C-methylase UbiE